MEEIKEKVDEGKYKLIREGLSDYERNKEINIPTHFSRELIKEGRMKGFDKVRYYKKK
jgi:hypothetical protein